MVPFPSRESFPGTEAQKEAIRLYMEQMKERYQPFAASDALELCALYWLHEDDAQEELIRYAAALTHAQGLRFLWIPFFNAHGFGRWKDLGFDSAILQPNHFSTLRRRSRSLRLLRWHGGTGWGSNWNLTSALSKMRAIAGAIWIIWRGRRNTATAAQTCSKAIIRT